MGAICFGTNTVWGFGAGNGPWIMADLESGLFSDQSPSNNVGDPSITNRSETAIVKGGPNLWAIKGADVALGGLSTGSSWA